MVGRGQNRSERGKMRQAKYAGKIRTPREELPMLQLQRTEKIPAPDWIENPVMIDPDKHDEQTSVLVGRV